MNRKPLTDKAGQVRELTAEDIRLMKPAAEVLPAELVSLLPKRRPGQRGPQKAPTKRQVTLRLDGDIIDRAKESGPGWQARINEMLRKNFGL